MKKVSAFRIVITAMFAALICVATMLVRIPIPATGGYANLGDGVILTIAFLVNPLYALIAAALGSFLADMLAGYASYALATLVIKGGVALIAAMIYCRFGSGRGSRLAMILAAVLAEVWMVLGYFLYEAVILGLGMAAAGGIVGNIGQGVVGVIVACIAAPVLGRSPELKERMKKL